MKRMKVLWSGPEAYRLTQLAERRFGDEPVLESLLERICTSATIKTRPTGAGVFVRRYHGEPDDWRFLGVTPLEDVRSPRGYYHFRFETDRDLTIEPCAEWEKLGSLELPLAPWTEAPDGMVYNWRYRPWALELGSLAHSRVLDLPGYYIDRFETTNREYQEFVDAGGYEMPGYWEAPLGEYDVAWDQVAGRFHDRTGKPGPSTWTDGRYPEGRADYPVGGISWFEAAAYARFRGKRLPSVYHWIAAARPKSNKVVCMVSRSNMGRRDIAPVGQYPGPSPCGVYDLAGNVREWCWNDSDAGRFILGASSSDEPYMFNQAVVVDPFNREAQNGVRCMKLGEGARHRRRLGDA